MISKGTIGRSRRWGVAISLAGLGVFLMQTPAGMIVDRVRRRPTLLAGASLLLGLCYGVLALVPAGPAVDDPLLFVAGARRVFPAAAGRPGTRDWSATGAESNDRPEPGLESCRQSGGGPVGHGPGRMVRGEVDLLCRGRRFDPGRRISLFVREREIDEARASGAAGDGVAGAGVRDSARCAYGYC